MSKKTFVSSKLKYFLLNIKSKIVVLKNVTLFFNAVVKLRFSFKSHRFREKNSIKRTLTTALPLNLFHRTLGTVRKIHSGPD